MLTTVGWILLFTEAISFTEGKGTIANYQYDWAMGGPPKLYATKDECQQQLQNLVFEDSIIDFEVKILKGGHMYAEYFKRDAGNVGRHIIVKCFEIRDSQN